MEKQTITIYDVAREANVSMATVSRVVNGNPNVKLVSQRAYYQSDYTNYLSNYFKDVEAFVKQYHICTKQVIVLQKA